MTERNHCRFPATFPTLRALIDRGNKRISLHCLKNSPRVLGNFEPHGSQRVNEVVPYGWAEEIPFNRVFAFL